MTTEEKRKKLERIYVSKEAYEYASELSMAGMPQDTPTIFKAGAEWAIKNHPDVMELHKRIKDLESELEHWTGKLK